MNRSPSPQAPPGPPATPSGPLDRAWRSFATGLCFVVFGAGTLLASAGLLLVVRPLPGMSAERKRRWVLATLRGLSRGLIELMQLLGLMRYRVVHTDRLRQPGQLIVSNHPSLIDALFVIGHSDELCCIVKRELLDNPFTGWLARVAGYLANDSDTLIDDAAEVLAGGCSLLVFPEGTRNRDDLSLRFRRGAAHIAIASGAPVRPVTIDFSPRSVQKGDPWYRIPARPSRIDVVAHALIDPVGEALRAAPPAADGEPLPVTRLARHVTQRLRRFYVQQTATFADPQGPIAAESAQASHSGDLIDARAAGDAVRGTLERAA